MSVTANQVGLYYSGAQYQEAIQNDPNKSLGNFRSNILIPNGTFDSLFEEVGFYELNTGQDVYRCIYIMNQSLTDAMANLGLYVSGNQTFESIKFGVSQPQDNVSPVQLLNSQYEMPYNTQFYESY